MPSSKVLREIYGFSPSALIELWTLDGTAIGLDSIYRFVNSTACAGQPIVFNGVQYVPFPIRTEGFEVDGKSSLPKPRLTVSNINGFTSALLLGNGNSLDGATVTRQRVSARFLDAANFPSPLPNWVTPDPSAAFSPEPFEINRKIIENNEVVSWELASVLESRGKKLPKRTILANTCRDWAYREAGTCDYSGVPVADVANRPFTGSFYSMTLVDKGAYAAGTTYARGEYVYTVSTLPQFSGIKLYWVCTTNSTVGVAPSTNTNRWVADACAKTSAACKLRFVDVPLRGSFFPGSSRAGFISRA